MFLIKLNVVHHVRCTVPRALNNENLNGLQKHSIAIFCLHSSSFTFARVMSSVQSSGRVYSVGRLSWWMCGSY